MYVICVLCIVNSLRFDNIHGCSQTNIFLLLHTIGFLDPAVLIEGVLFRARYLGSTQLVCEGQPTKSTRMMQAEEAVSRIKVSSI